MSGSRRPLTLAVGVLLVVALAAGSACANPSYQVPLGPRAIAMGSAFSAVADDASAIFWNPAGLSRIDNQEIMVTNADLYGLGIQDNFAAFVLPLTRNHVAAVGWYRSGFDDDELGFGENIIDLSYGYRAYDWLSVGATAKYLNRSTDLDGVEVSSGNGRGLDLGVLATPWRGLRLGLVGQDVFGTEIEFAEGSSEAYPPNTRLAAAYAFGSRGIVALDLDDRYHLGGEVWFFDMVALRAGLEKDREGDEDVQYTFGGGIEYGIFRVDYAYVNHPTLDATNHFGLSMAFNFNPSRVRIEKVEPRELYASLYKSYADRPVGSVVLRNLEEKPISARVSTFIPGLMDGPSMQEVILRPKAVQEVPMTAVLADHVIEEGGDRPIQMQVEVSYRSQRLPRTEKRSGGGVCYGPGAIDWGTGLDQAAAFVTPRDPAVATVARSAARSTDPTGREDLPSRNIRYAAAMFDALSALGIAYVPDPHNPYSAISETPRAVDTIHYPRETLAAKGGDCDDTSVLMASLLANVGVRTQLIDVPGHLFLLVDTGIHERNRLAMGLEEQLYVVDGDLLWIPLETTAVGEGFAEAWRRGADEYHTWHDRGRLALADLSTAQQIYAPAEFAAPASLPELDGARVARLVAQDVEEIRGWRETYMAARFGEVRDGLATSPQALGQLAHAYYLGGRTDEARGMLEQVLAEDPGSALAHNNLAVLSAASGDMAGGLEHAARAVESAPDDPGVWLNLGLLRYASGGDAESALANGLSRSDGFEDACRLLGLQLTDDDSRAAAEALTPEEIQALLREVLANLPAAEFTVGAQDSAAALGTPTPVASEEILEPPRAIKLRVAGSRAAERMQLVDYLYWKKEGR